VHQPDHLVVCSRHAEARLKRIHPLGDCAGSVKLVNAKGGIVGACNNWMCPSALCPPKELYL